MRARGKTGEKSGQGRNEPHPADIHVGLRLRERRIVLGMSQTKLAATLGLTFQQVYKYEQGKNRISAGRLYDLSRFLGVPITFFFEGIVGSSPTAPLASGRHNDPLDPREATELFAAYRAIPDSVVRRRLRQLRDRLFRLTGRSPRAANLGRRPAVDFSKDGVEPSQAPESCPHRDLGHR
jgi:transcriptional regulator with XRE-family HTH domain